MASVITIYKFNHQGCFTLLLLEYMIHRMLKENNILFRNGGLVASDKFFKTIIINLIRIKEEIIMYNKLVAIAISLVFLIIGFSGCIDLGDVTKFSITSFNVEPSLISVGETANLSWVVMSAETVSIDNGIGNVSNIGDRNIIPTETTTYTLTARNGTKTLTATTQIIVVDDSSEDNNETFELVSYTVETYEVCILPNTINKEDAKIGDGFIHPDRLGAYEINGIVKNKSGQNGSVEIIMNFFDKDDIILDSKSLTIEDMPNNNEQSFRACFDWMELENFENVEKVTFELKEV